MPQCRATAPIGVVTIFREIRDSDLGMEASLRQRLGDIEGQARKDAARADAMLRDAMSDVIDNAQVRLSHFFVVCDTLEWSPTEGYSPAERGD